MDKILEKQKECYILALAQQGAKLPSDFDVTNLKWDEEDSPLDVTQKLQDLQIKMERMKIGKIQSIEFSLKKVCPLPFDKNIAYTPFPQNIKIPKYDNYSSTSDPQDHLRKFYTLSMEFFHNTTYLIQLFPRSLGGQAME